MNPIREYVTNAFATYRLKPEFYALTTRVGLAGVFLGLVVFWFYVKLAWTFLGVPDNESIPMSSPAAKWFIVFLFAGIPTCIYLGCALIAGLTGAALVRSGKFSRSEAVSYALLSRYPARWFKDAA